MTTQLNQWTRMLDTYPTLREALDAVRRLERDRFRRQVYQVNKDQVVAERNASTAVAVLERLDRAGRL
jgi:hypothetical protein